MPHTGKNKRKQHSSGSTTPKKESPDKKKLKPLGIDKYFEPVRENNLGETMASNDNANSETENNQQQISSGEAGILQQILEKVSLIPDIIEKLENIRTELDEVKSKAEENKTEIEIIKTSKDLLELKVDEMETKLEKVEKNEKNNSFSNALEIAHQKQVSLLQSQVENLETLSRRNNLIFQGIPESADENLYHKIRHIIKDKLQMNNADTVRFVQVHRIGKVHPNYRFGVRPVLVSFQFYPDAVEVFKKRMLLNHQGQEAEGDTQVRVDTNIYISLDFPENIRRKRRELSKVMKVAKVSDPTCHLISDKLLFKKRKYSLAESYDIPGVPITTIGTRVINDYVYFFGRFSVFSNFYPSNFMVSGNTFSCNEQYYQFRKATHTGKNILAAQILQAQDPVEMKRLGDTIDKELWPREIALRSMTEGLRNKFSQNEALKNALLATGHRHLVECSKSDLFWGIGSALKASGNITGGGLNLLGQCLDEVRSEI